jgi:hypothetical protein
MKPPDILTSSNKNYANKFNRERESEVLGILLLDIDFEIISNIISARAKYLFLPYCNLSK